MNSKIYLLSAASLALLATSCGKKLSQFPADYFTVNPNPLELVADRVPATVTANVPAKFFLKNAEVTVTPYLVFAGQEVASQSFSFQGEKVRGNNPVISYDNGGTVSIPVMYNWQPDMISSVLELAFDVRQGGKQYVLPRVQVATGVVATAEIVEVADITPAYSADNFQRIINEQYNADIKFLINKANIRPDQLKEKDMVDFNQTLKDAAAAPNQEIAEINIASYASPDGVLAWNTKLAQQREDATSKYLTDKLKKDNVTEFGELTANFTPEDWEGFQQLVSASNIQDKELILSVLSMYKDPETREKEIRNMATIFDQLADNILPQLRRSRLTASINVIGKSDAELLALAASDPKQLTCDELLYTATLVDNNADRMRIYDAAAKQNPSDYRAFNDLGMTQFIAGDYDAARANFKQAARLAPDAAEAQMNQGLLDLMDKNYAAANQRFGAAAGVPELGEATGTYFLMMGDYPAAAKAFGSAKTNNAALAQILNKDYSKAKQTLAGIANPNADTYYLSAILGARTNNQQMVSDNLKQAIRLDPSLKGRASKDLEFVNFNNLDLNNF